MTETTKTPTTHKIEKWESKYNGEYFLGSVDITRPFGNIERNGETVRWTYLIAIDGERKSDGSLQAHGWSKPAIIDGHKKEAFTLIEAGDIIETPYGNFTVEFQDGYIAGKKNYDYLTVKEVTS